MGTGTASRAGAAVGTGTSMGSSTAVELNRINENSGAFSKQIWTMRQRGPAFSSQRETGSGSLSGGMWLPLPSRECCAKTHFSLDFPQTSSEFLVPIHSSSSTGLLSHLPQCLYHQGCSHTHSVMSTIRAAHTLSLVSLPSGLLTHFPFEEGEQLL